MNLIEKLRIRWDRLRGLDFHSAVEPEALGLDPSLAFRSSPSGNHYLAAVLGAIGVMPSDRIIDVGCGKGSAMRVMCRFPFGRVAGIELSPDIARVARRNFERLRARNVVVHAGDAADFEGYGEYNVIYFYNPFPAVVMRRVLDRIAAGSAAGAERLVIYNNPVCDALLLERGFSAIRDYPDEWGNGIRLYSSHGAASARVAHLARGGDGDRLRPPERLPASS